MNRFNGLPSLDELTADIARETAILGHGREEVIVETVVETVVYDEDEWENSDWEYSDDYYD